MLRQLCRIRRNGAAWLKERLLVDPLAFDHQEGASLQAGAGDVELGAKYRFITPGEDDWYPQVGTFPLLEIPSGNAARAGYAALTACRRRSSPRTSPTRITKPPPPAM